MMERTDICIVGTGAAGGILAYRLAMAGREVLSLEQGEPIADTYFTNELNPEDEPHFGITPDMPWDLDPGEGFYFGNAQANKLYARADERSTSAVSQDRFKNLQIFRLNGKTNLWNAVALRYSQRDFRPKDHGEADTNWPIGYDDLAPHYSAVEQLIGVCGTREGITELPDGEFLPPLPLRPADRLLIQALRSIREVPIRAIPVRKAIETRPDHPNRCRDCGDCFFGCSSGSVYKFSSRLMPRIIDRTNYRLRCGMKVVRLSREPGTNRIAAVECLDTHSGRMVRVEARVFVLCAGALETPRLLFNSRDAEFPEGLGNRSGLVGCFLQDNVKAVVGTALLKLFGARSSGPHGTDDAMLIPRFLFDQREFRGGYLGNFSHFLPKRPYYVGELPRLPFWLKRRLARWIFHSFAAVLFFGKAETRRTNRVTSSEARDRFGIPQIDVHYAFTDSDRRMQQSMIQHGRRILRKCSGTFISEFPDKLPGGAIHYAGTCRMSDGADTGVVDANLRTFDHPNLYVCDGSVMTEISEKNLTLTIMALADRLAGALERAPVV